MLRVLTYVTIAIAETVAWIKLFNSDNQYEKYVVERIQNCFKVWRVTLSVTTSYFCSVFPP